MAQLIMTKMGDRWRGMRLLALTCFPAKAEADMGLGDLFALRAISCELLIMKEKQNSSMTILLALRWFGADRTELERRITGDSKIILSRIQGAGMDAHYIDNTPEQNAPLAILNRWISGQAAREDSFSVGFYPREQIITANGRRLYIPGSWGKKPEAEAMFFGEEELFSLDWNKIMRVLNGYAPVLFSLQWAPTSLRPEEYRSAEGIVRSCETEKEKNPFGIKTKYHQLLEKRTKPFCQLTLWMKGSRVACQDMRSLVQTWQIEAVDLPAKTFPCSGYLLRGDLLSAAVMDRDGHMQQFRGKLGQGLRRMTRLSVKEEAASFVGVPGQYEGIPGLQIVGKIVILPEKMAKKGENVLVGRRKDTEEKVYLPLDQLSRHGCITGMPGSGKTNFALGFLYRIWKEGVPFLAVEPAKREYRALTRVIPDLQVLTPGDSTIAPISCNMFLPPAGITLEQHLPSLYQIFEMSFSMDSLLKNMFTETIRMCYMEHGWSDDSTRDSKGVRVFGLREFIQSFRTHTRQVIKDPESRNNVENGGELRLKSLLERNPDMFDTNLAPDYESMLRKPTVLELDAMTDETQKSLVLAMILVNLMALIRQRTDMSGKLRNVILIDEAHVVLNPADQRRDTEEASPGAAGLKMLQNMTLIFRAYGTALFFGDQSPEKLTREILGNVATKITFKLQDGQDRELMGQTALLDREKLEKLPTLLPGEGYLTCGELEKPILLQTPNAEEDPGLPKDVPDADLRKRTSVTFPSPFTQCAGCGECAGNCDPAIRKMARSLTEQIKNLSEKLREVMPAVPEEAEKTKHLIPGYLKDTFPREAEEAARERGFAWTSRLADCCRVHMIRSLLIDGNCQLSEAELTGEKPVQAAQADFRNFGAVSAINFRD